MERKSAVWAWEKERRSLRSAPAQKAASDSEARIRARVGPVEGSEARVLISWERSWSNWVLIALRAAGRLREMILMLPL